MSFTTDRMITSHHTNPDMLFDHLPVSLIHQLPPPQVLTNMPASLSFLLPNSPPLLTTNTHRTLPSRKHARRRPPHLHACLDSPGSKPTSASPLDRPLPPQQRLDSNATPDAPRTDDSADQNTTPSSQTSTQTNSAVPMTFGPFSFSLPARWLLYSVPFFWGSFGPSVRLLFAQHPHQDPSVFNTERLVLSTLVYVPVLYAEFQTFLNRAKPQSSDSPENPFAFFPAGIELGVYVFLANVAQVIGLQQTSASRAAFLVQLQTVIVPVLSGFFGIDKVSAKTWISSAVAVAGVALLSSDKGHGTVSSLTGDALEILSALFFSTYIIRLGKYCNALPANPLVATKIATQAFLSIGWAFAAELGNLFSHAPTHISSTTTVEPWTLATVAINISVVAWTGLMTSAVSGWAQTKGQQGVPASEAVVIFATQPLWASALAALILGESFGPRGFAGGALIVAATLLASKKTEEPNKDT